MATVLGRHNRFPYTRNFDDFGKGATFLANGQHRKYRFAASLAALAAVAALVERRHFGGFGARVHAQE